MTVVQPAPTEAGYPPEPWDLRGQLHGSLFLVPLHDVPLDLPPGCRPIRLAGRAVVGAVWVSYEPGGVLSYRELMTTLLVRRGWRLLPTITHIWVDSVPSRDGGRALWGIPKALASFAFAGGELAARDDEGPLATGSVRPGRRLPGRWPVRFSVVQSLDGRAKVSPVRSSASVSMARASFEADPSGPLAFLSGRRPLLSFSLGDFRMSFGG
jgi:acetoacetate decarboxylase